MKAEDVVAELQIVNTWGQAVLKDQDMPTKDVFKKEEVPSPSSSTLSNIEMRATS